MYHAIYLEELTALELTEKLAQLFSISSQQISQIYKQGPTGIHVLISDEVTSPRPLPLGCCSGSARHRALSSAVAVAVGPRVRLGLRRVGVNRGGRGRRCQGPQGPRGS